MLELFGKVIRLLQILQMTLAMSKDPLSSPFLTPILLEELLTCGLTMEPISLQDINLSVKKTIDEATSYYPYINDGWLFFPVSFSKGGFGRVEIEKDTKYTLPKELAEKCSGWGGAGGSLFQFCPKYNLSFSYVMNYYGANFVNDPRNVPYLNELLRLAKENANN